MGYYQGSDHQLEESLGRNSRHFTPSPYYSSSARRRHGPLGTHPGLSHGHSQQLRRPRQTKSSYSPTAGSSQSFEPSYSFGAPSIFIPTTEGFFPTLGPTDFVTRSSVSTSDFDDTISMNMSDLPISMPLPTTTETVDILQLNSEATPSSTSHNPFSSSLWGIPTSTDSDEWMLYMQNSRGTDSIGTNSLDAGRTQARTSKTDQGIDIFRSLEDMNSAVPTMDNNDLQANSYSTGSRGGTHPLAQSLTSNDLLPWNKNNLV